MPISLHTAVFHALEEQIAVIDESGEILEVNQAWLDFGAANGLRAGYASVGHNYIQALADSVAGGDRLAAEALQGITAVLTRQRALFYLEYPCHSPSEKRWFTMRVAALPVDAGGGLFVISHHNVTQRKLAEMRVEELAMQDPLTGLGNRRAFNLALAKEKASSARYRMPMALALIDIDYFKQYNDALGHAAGDQCLVDLGAILQAHARRPGDVAARIGGDEFAVILSNTSSQTAGDIMLSILAEIRALKLVFGESMRVTASIGLLSGIATEQQNEDFLFREADKALYRAKAAGRDQLCPIVLGTTAPAP